MSYGSKVYFLDFRGGQWGKNYNIVSPNFGTEYMVYYQTMTSATYGIGAGVYLENALLPSNTYRVTYLWAVPTGGCSIYDWNQFGVLNNLSDNGQQNLASRQVPSIDQGLLEFDENITLNVCVYSVTFVPDNIGSALVLPMKSGSSTTEAFVFWGFVLEDAGNGLVLQSTINDNFNSIRTQNQTIINQNTQINNSINDLKDADYNGTTEQPNTSNYDDYEDAEEDLLDNMDNMDLDDVTIAIDTNSSNFVWNTMTSLIQSNALIFSMIISILSLGVVKLMLGR